MANDFAQRNADEINAHLRAGGVVQVATYASSTIYKPGHAGAFYAKGGCLYVKKGKSGVCLSTGQMLLVAIRFGSIR